MKRKNEEMVDNIAGSTSNVCSIYAVPRPDDRSPEKPSSMLLTDMDILCCCVCSHLLSFPIFQCENGHAACRFCTIDGDEYCSSCLSPTAKHHNLMIEKVIKSAKIPCQNQKLGCPEIVSFYKGDRYAHREECKYVPFTCPFSSCNFESLLEQMSLHIITRHSAKPILFRFDHKFDVELGTDASFAVLQEEEGKNLFVLHRRCEPHERSIFWLSRVPPVFEDGRGRFFYNFFCESEEAGFTVSFETIAADRGDVYEDGLPRSGYLVAPPRADGGYVNFLEVSIRDDNK